MTSRVMLISPAMSAALREARFDDGCPLDPAGLRLAEAAAGSLPAADLVLVSPTVRCRETAAALGLDALALTEPPELAGLDVGRWRGATLAEVSAGEPEAVGRWLADPSSAPHGGESVAGLCERVAKWLETVADPGSRAAGSDSGSAGGSGPGSVRIIAVVEPEIVRAGVVRALGAPESAFWRVDVPPLVATELSGRAGRWNVRVGTSLGE
ncbi:histidine phosphatase family protein [Streptomyces phaeochromogenes]|uniref:histidine phosphatase family protein n=1 Tax=Streptomyces phaeochromogenes TaxID=1923 RepID=UPI0022599C3C|nr:histidine phosphatase family protein [Streptomyces phaeochromogenes]MCX5599337.1 histidine phosphatase family protein [Streptomyces phaeochromogenes]